MRLNQNFNDWLKKHIGRAISDLRENVFSGINVPKRLIPKYYIDKYNIDNLWKYDLPKGWRLLYTIINENEIQLLSIILDWMNHKDYERRFGYE